jgi:hypothetical protein
MSDLLERQFAAAIGRGAKLQAEVDRLTAEIARLQTANRQSMAVADARSIENVALAAEVARLRAALTTARLYIKDEMIAHAVVVPPGAQPPFNKHPSLLKFIDAAIRADEQSDTKTEGK